MSHQNCSLTREHLEDEAPLPSTAIGSTRTSPSATTVARSIGKPKTHQQRDEPPSRRRSSLSTAFSSFRHAGGANSLDNFARSLQRAAGFHEIPSLVEPPFVNADTTDIESAEPGRRPLLSRSLLCQQLSSTLNQEHQEPFEEAVDDDLESQPERGNTCQIVGERFSGVNQADLFRNAASLHVPLGSSLGSSYGTVSSRIQDTSRRHEAQSIHAHKAAALHPSDKEQEPLLAKQTSTEEGQTSVEIVGQSTLPQTVFNSVNTLIGVGLLSLPLGIKYAGWLIGLLFLGLCAVVTSYTAKILTICLDVDPSLVTYADIAYVSFGRKARLATGLLFSLELVAACVALVVLFADSLHALIPGGELIHWKIFCGILLIPLNFAPLRVLSISSILGIICCFGVVSLVFVDGLIKPHHPGSLRDPMMTGWFPEHWSTLPLSFGLLMSPWGGHSVFPSIYRDMRHPQKFAKNLRYSFSFTFGLDLSMAVFGFLMFGDHVQEEVTSNILSSKGYPRALSIIIVVLITVIPITKIPLNCRPIVNTVEVLCGIDPRASAAASGSLERSPFCRGMLQALTRILVVVLIVVVAIAVPAFDVVMALLGSGLCFAICIILPLAFYLKIFGRQISVSERILDGTLILCCSVMAIVGTVWAFLPKSQIGAGIG